MSLPSASTQIAVPASSKTDTRLHGRWLLIARIGWIVLAVLAPGLYVAGTFVFSGFLRTICTSTPATCANYGRLTPNDVQSLQAMGLSPNFFTGGETAVYIVFVVVYVGIGILIFWRRSDDRMALFASLTLILFPAGFNSTLLLILPSALLLPYQVMAFLGNISLFLFFYLFPSGQFVPRWTRWLTIGVMAFWAVYAFFPFLHFNSTLPFIFLLLGFICSALVAQVYRYRHVSNPLQRQQTRWVVFGISIALCCFLILSLFSVFFSSSVPQGPLTVLITAMAYYFVLLLIPLSIGIAILRSHLFDIDLIINRTLVYGLLTTIVIGLYVLVVGGLSTLLQARGDLLISLLATGLIAILFQPLRERLQYAVNRLMYGERSGPYSIISRLGTQLEATLTPDAILPTVVETVANALKLPYVAIELKEEGEFQRVVAFGTPAEPSLSLPLRYQQETIGQMLLASRSPGESFSTADRHLLDDLARQAGIAANTVLLSEDLQRSRERLLLAREEERRRLARELHDSVSQALYGISLGAHAARMALDRDPEQVAEPLDYILSLADAALAEMRALIFELRPESLEAEGLVSALSKQAAALQARYTLTVATQFCEEPELALPIKEDMYRVAQEAMHNIVKHAHANHVDLRLDQTLDGIILEIHDDGTGFDTTASFPGHLGLQSMRERIARLGGTFEIESTPDVGTRICVHVPHEG